MQQLALKNLLEFYRKNEKEILVEYFEFLRFKSISSEPEFKEDTLDCAKWLKSYLHTIGFETELWSSEGHPVVYAHHLKAGQDKPTLLIYNHYDVQPVDPLYEWQSPPFEPTIRENQVFARGAQDNKGQCFYTILALKYLLTEYNQLPLNIKLCIEGEEECGSTALSKLLKEKASELKADYLAVVDMGIRGPNSPSISLGIRGIVTMDVEVQGSLYDMHSGSNGGLAYNPNHALIQILSTLRHTDGKIAIPGFYDDVIPFSDEDKKKVSWTFDANEYEKVVGAVPSGGESNLLPLERNWIRPTLEINGISGGYQGTGFKTVIPAKASAKISCRLVPGQHPQIIGRLVANFIERSAPPGIQVKVSVHPGGGCAVRSNPDSKVVRAFAQAYTEVFKMPVEFVLEGASIPIITELAQISQSEVVLVGLGLQDDMIHAPNEHFGLDRIEKGFAIIVKALENLSM